MSNNVQCMYLRPAVYTLAALGAVILVVALFGGFEPHAIAGN